MSARRKVVASGVLGLLIAISAVTVISLSGVPPVRPLSNSGTTSQGGSPETSSTTLTSNTGGSSGQESSAVTTTGPSQGQASGEQGVISVLVTDPPHVPAGVSAIYAYYIGLAVHRAQGWTTVMVAGEIELMGTVNVAQTLASANIPAGSYDQVKFDLTSALVTYNGANYTASVEGGHLAIRILGGAIVSSSQPSAALIDIQPMVVNVGSQTSPQFVLWAEARAFPVPQSQITATMRTEGNRFPLRGLSWWLNDENMANATLAVSGVSLSASSLNLTVADIGTTGTMLKLVVVSEATQTAGMMEDGSVPSAITGTAVFVVLANGTMAQFVPLLHVSLPMMSGESQTSVLDVLRSPGYNLTAGSSIQLSYSGSIELSFGLFAQPNGITSGNAYRITVVGDNTIASTEVTAT
ncbi:MAG TPA: DUF4382 domain-containing protein [Nitrososphaerales archaeon]|nr:DUF4382 domain-containing protein [Nitrososphaerales archaeon]